MRQRKHHAEAVIDGMHVFDVQEYEGTPWTMPFVFEATTSNSVCCGIQVGSGVINGQLSFVRVEVADG